MIKIKRSEDGQWYSVILAGNNKVLHTSETYKTKRSCLKGVTAAIKALKNPKIVME